MKIKKNKFKKKNIYDFFGYLLCFFLVLNCRSMWTTIPGIRTNFRYITDFIIVLSCIVLGTRISLNKIKKATLYSLFTFLYMLFFLVINDRSVQEYLSFTIKSVALLFLGYSLRCQKRYEIIFGKLVNVILLIASISTIIWVVGPVLNIISPTGTVETLWTGTGSSVSIPSYYNLLFVKDSSTLWGSLITRNLSIFCEAPMASFVFCIGFIIELFLCNTNKKKIFIFVVCIITTMSSMGYIVVIGSLTVKYILTKQKFSLLKILKVIIIPILMILGILVINELITIKLGQSSGSIRLDDFRIGFEVWKNKPLFGYGFNNEQVLQKHMLSWRSYNTGYSNSLFYILTNCGLYIGWFYLFSPLHALFVGIKKNNWTLSSFSLIFLFMFILTQVSYTSLPVFVMLYCFFVTKKQ